MGHMSYDKVTRRSSHGKRCFKLKYPRRFSVYRLRAKIFCLFDFFSRWRSSYGEALESLKKGLTRCSSSRRESGCRRNLVLPDTSRAECRLRSFGRSNSFYSEAIADCLEFIKRSSVSGDEYNPVNQTT